MLFNERRIEELEKQCDSLRAAINGLVDIIDDLRVAQVELAEYQAEVKEAKMKLASKGRRIAQDRKAMLKASQLLDELQIMGEDYPCVAEMLSKK